MEFDSLSQVGGSYTPAPQYTSPEPVAVSQGQDTGNSAAAKTADSARASAKTKSKSGEAESDKNGDNVLKVTEDEINKTIQTANKKIEPLFLEFQYKIHSKTNSLVISIINTDTKEVVREIPPEKTLDALAKMWELAGILVDKKG